MSRSKTMLRGGRSGSVRWWLFSAISLNFSFSTTWSTQNDTASAVNTTFQLAELLPGAVERRRLEASLARDQKRPTLDLVVGYDRYGLAGKPKTAVETPL